MRLFTFTNEDMTIWRYIIADSLGTAQQHYPEMFVWYIGACV